MKINELQDFLLELEDVATYCNLPIDEKRFSNSMIQVKDLFKEANIDIPIELKKSLKSYDYRSEMQKLGGYKIRRERIKEVFYPLIEYLESKIDIINQNSIFTQGKLNDFLRLNSFSIKTIYGNITNISISETGAGGNGIVYFGNLNNHDVAIKFLIKNDTNKRERFLCEFLNIIMSVNNNEGIVKQYFYEEVVIDNCKVPIIVMKKYSNHLAYVETINQDLIISYFHQLAQALKIIHDNGIIHRDLKPQNILIDEKGRLNIADFGISNYNSEIFDLTGHTQKGDRLANFEFSAPEQRNSKIEITKAADIYALGQIIYWLVFDETCKGTRRKKITDKYSGNRMVLLDNIVDKCIANDPKDRYQTIDEIYDDIALEKEYNISKKDVDSKKEKIEKSANEIKKELEDIMQFLTFTIDRDDYGNEFETTTFQVMDEFSPLDISIFLSQIEYKQNELLFFDRVKMSDFFDTKSRLFFKEYYIDKKYFTNLYNLYNEIKDDEKLLAPFIKYIVNTFNNNCIELPF